jgi:antitoxin VapB
MALNIKDEATHELARRLAAATGESLTIAVRVAIEDRLTRIERAAHRPDADLVARLDAIARHCGALPVLDDSSEDEILGYDESGLPGRW